MKLQWLKRLEEYVSSLFFVVGMLVSFYTVIMRYVFKASPTWSLEIFEFVMAWAIFLGFGMALRDGHHITVDLLYDRLPDSVKRVVNVVANIIGLGYSIFMTVTGVQITLLAYQQGIITTDTGIPVWLTYVVMPIGMGLLAVHFLVKGYRALKGEKKQEQASEKIVYSVSIDQRSSAEKS